MISERNGKHGQFKARIFEEQKKPHMKQKTQGKPTKNPSMESGLGAKKLEPDYENMGFTANCS